MTEDATQSQPAGNGDVVEAEIVFEDEGTVFEDEAIVFESQEDDPIVEEPRDIMPHELGIDLPDDPAEAIQVALAEVVSARTDADTYLTDLQRLAADFENYRKRTMREQSAHVERASQRVVESLLPVLDSFDAAFTHEAQSPSEEKLLSGVRGTYHQLLDVLKREGLEPIPALGEPFDPEMHEAVSTLATGEGDLVVAAELRTGFRLRGRVLRPSLVTVDHA